MQRFLQFAELPGNWGRWASGFGEPAGFSRYLVSETTRVVFRFWIRLLIHVAVDKVGSMHFEWALWSQKELELEEQLAKLIRVI